MLDSQRTGILTDDENNNKVKNMNTSCVKCNIYLFERWRECYKINYNDPSFQTFFIGPTITVASILIAKVSVRYYILLFMSKRQERQELRHKYILRISDKEYFCPKTENVREGTTAIPYGYEIVNPTFIPCVDVRGFLCELLHFFYPSTSPKFTNTLCKLKILLQHRPIIEYYFPLLLNPFPKNRIEWLLEPKRSKQISLIFWTQDI